MFFSQENVAAVNEALNELYIEDEDYEKLRESVDDYDNFDQAREYLTGFLLYIVRVIHIFCPSMVKASRSSRKMGWGQQ